MPIIDLRRPKYPSGPIAFAFIVRCARSNEIRVVVAAAERKWMDVVNVRIDATHCRLNIAGAHVVPGGNALEIRKDYA